MARVVERGDDNPGQLFFGLTERVATARSLNAVKNFNRSRLVLTFPKLEE
jgi:hypothetical protein